MVGSRLSHYIILEKLGEGGMGVVYKAEDVKLHRLVALKVFPSVATASADDRARFFQEARLASSLNHPNIVTIHEFDEVDGTAFIAAEYVEGRTLAALLQDGLLPITSVLEIAAQVAAGVAEAHRRGIIHRDLKPDNVMVSTSGQVKVTDFGLARLMGSSHLTTPGSLIGTFAYMSPEQIDNKDVDHRADIFSFGILFYQLATGRMPFQGKTIAELLSAIARHHPEPLRKLRPEIPAECERIVSKAMQKEPARRYASLDMLQADLHRVMTNPAMKPRYETRDIVRRLLPAGLVVGMLLLAGTAYVFYEQWAARAASPASRAVAVLPLTNESGDSTIAFLGIGFADDIIARLSMIRSLAVRPTSAVSGYRGRHVDASAIGTELAVDYVLEGRYRKRGDDFAVSTQLVDARSGQEIWHGEFAFPWKDVQRTQEQVANRLVEALNLELSAKEYSGLHRQLTGSADAYEYYLRGKAYTLRDSRENNELAASMFERAVTLDGKFAEAYSALSNAYTERFWSNYSPDTVWIGRGLDAAHRALQIDSQLAAAHAALGFAQRVAGHYPESILEALRALRLDPRTSFALEELSEFYRNNGDFATAETVAQRAFAIDPSFNIFRVRSRILQFQGRHAEAVQELEKAIARSPQDSWLRGGLLALSYVYLGKLSEAEEQIRIANAIDSDKPETRITRAMVYTIRGEYEAAEKELDSIGSYLHRDYALSHFGAAIYSMQGRTDRALDLLEESVALGNRWYSRLADPWFEHIRTTGRFKTIERKLRDELSVLAADIKRQPPF